MVRATTLQKVAAHDEGVWAVAWLPDSTQLLTGSVDESVKLWNLSENSLEASHAYTGNALGVISLDVEPSGAYAVSSSLDSVVRIYSMEDKSVKQMVERPPTETWRTVFGAVTAESRQLAVAGGSKGQVYTYRGGADEPELELTLDLPQVRCCREAREAGGMCVVPNAARIRPLPPPKHTPKE
jgi:WD repeat-containing protein 61